MYLSVKDDITYSNNGTSEAPMRNQFRAWAEYMGVASGDVK
jgi:hypothetical protein